MISSTWDYDSELHPGSVAIQVPAQHLRTGAQCMWQVDAHAVFPPGACVSGLKTALVFLMRGGTGLTW